MARTHSTSRKRSAASSSRREPPESLVFFIDRSLGRRKVPEALRAAGLDVRVHDELSPQSTQDVVWLAEAGVQRWVVITRDDRIRYNQLEKQAVVAAQLRFLAALILSAVRAVTRLCQQHAGGFIAKISRGPEVKIIDKSRL